jgi:hypothetical protein
VPLYLKTNKSPRSAVVVNTGAVSEANSYTAFQVKVLVPVASCITSKETNCPAEPPVGALIVLLPAKVTLATGAAFTAQSMVAPSVKVAS